MPADTPSSRDRSPQGRHFIARLFAVVLLLVAANVATGIYVEDLWFDSLGFGTVYWYRLMMQAGVFLAVGIVTTSVLWASFRLVLPDKAETLQAVLFSFFTSVFLKN